MKSGDAQTLVDHFSLKITIPANEVRPDCEDNISGLGLEAQGGQGLDEPDTTKMRFQISKQIKVTGVRS